MGERKVPSISELRERVSGGLSEELLEKLPGMVVMRLHAHSGERVPLFMISSVCRFLTPPLKEHGSDDARLSKANERFVPATDALLQGLEDQLGPAELYGLLDDFVSAAAGANRSLAFGEGTGHP